MGLDQLSKFVQNMVKSIIKYNGIRDSLIQVAAGFPPGDGFASESHSVTVTDNKQDKRLDLFCKVSLRNIDPIIFVRETIFYEKLMPIFYELQRNKNIPREDLFLSYIRCYDSKFDPESGRHAIIMEDARPNGFEMWNKKVTQPIENVRISMRELGKFHGLTMALKDDKFEEPRKQLQETKEIINQNNLSPHMMTVYDSFLNQAIEYLKSENHKDILRHIHKNINAYLDDCLGVKASERFGVICHGDFWNNNMLFKYVNGVPQDIRLLDWQRIQYLSPATDILYNLFTSTDGSLRNKEFDNLIEIYYNSLSKTVRSVGSNADKLFTIHDLKDELKKCGNYALILSPIFAGVSQVDSKLIKKMAGIENLNLIPLLSDEGRMEYGRRLNEVFDDIVDLGYYHKIN